MERRDTQHVRGGEGRNRSGGAVDLDILGRLILSLSGYCSSDSPSLSGKHSQVNKYCQAVECRWDSDSSSYKWPVSKKGRDGRPAPSMSSEAVDGLVWL